MKQTHRMAAALLAAALTLPVLASATAICAAEAEKTDISVTLTVYGDHIHAEGETELHTLADGNLTLWIAEKDYTVADQSTVAALVESVLASGGCTFEMPTTEYGAYIESVTKDGVTLAGGTNGMMSGWVFLVNGEIPSVGIAEQMLSDGDAVILSYTDDVMREYDYIEDKKAADKTSELIDKIGTITPASEKAITKAQKAYDALTESQKALVSNYALLAAARTDYAALISSSESLEELVSPIADYLVELGIPKISSTSGSWRVIALARAGKTFGQDFYDEVVDYVKSKINENGQLHATKSTENSRIILTLTMLGYDVTDVGGHDLLRGLSDAAYVQKQGINGPIWALIAIDSHHYSIPANESAAEQTTPELLIDCILNRQLEDGGWALSGSVGDPDVTAMALVALAPHRDDPKVAAAIAGGVDCLSKMQGAFGGFSSFGSLTAESCAQVVLALTTLGIDPAADPRFVKNGCSAADALAAFYLELEPEKGGLAHTMGAKVNVMASEQGFEAIIAEQMLRENKGSFFDMTDIEITNGGVPDTPETPDNPESPKTGSPIGPMVMVLLLIGAAGGAAFVRRREN